MLIQTIKKKVQKRKLFLYKKNLMFPKVLLVIFLINLNLRKNRFGPIGSSCKRSGNEKKVSLCRKPKKYRLRDY